VVLKFDVFVAAEVLGAYQIHMYHMVDMLVREQA
jgi:hypothetical protein